MRQISLAELGSKVASQRERLWQVAGGVGRKPKVYLHWSAGRYSTLFDDYHVNITGDGEIFIATEDLTELLPHTWKRNTGSIGIAVACGYGADSASLGSYAPTKKQIEVMAQVISTICKNAWLFDSQNGITKEYVMTHGEAADNEDGLNCHENYGPKSTVERWDLEYLGTQESPSYNPWATNGTRGGDVLRGKANWYFKNT